MANCFSAILETVKAYQTLVVGGLAVLGVIVTLIFNAWLARRQHSRQVEHETKVLRVALLAEPRAFAQAYRERIAKIKETPSDEGTSIILSLDTMTDVHRSMIGRLGLLLSAEVEAVLQAYLLIRQLPDRINFFEGKHAAPPGYWRVDALAFADLATLHDNYLFKSDSAIAVLRNG